MAVPLPWATEWDLMVGMDEHNELMYPVIPAPMTPHIVAATLHWAANDDQWKKRNVFVEGRLTCKHFHDIAHLIPHIPCPFAACLLLPAIIPLSGSKIVFGSFSVHRNGERVGVLPNAHNCWSGFPRPSGVIIPTRLPTVWVGISFIDFALSLLLVAVDMLVSWMLNNLFDKYLRDFIASKLVESANTVFWQIAVQIRREIAKKLVTKITKQPFDWLRKKIEEWFGRTNPGMEEKYIRIFEAEAPSAFADYAYVSTYLATRESIAETLMEEIPGIDANVILSDPAIEVSYPDFEKGFINAYGTMVRDAVRGFLSSDEWRKFLDTTNDVSET